MSNLPPCCTRVLLAERKVAELEDELNNMEQAWNKRRTEAHTLEMENIKLRKYLLNLYQATPHQTIKDEIDELLK